MNELGATIDKIQLFQLLLMAPASPSKAESWSP